MALLFFQPVHTITKPIYKGSHLKAQTDVIHGEFSIDNGYGIIPIDIAFNAGCVHLHTQLQLNCCLLFVYHYILKLISQNTIDIMHKVNETLLH